MIILPRQARDKHRESTQKKDAFLGVIGQVLDSHGDELAACILEPTGASWGRVPLDDGFLSGVRELTAKHGA